VIFLLPGTFTQYILGKQAKKRHYKLIVMPSNKTLLTQRGGLF